MANTTRTTTVSDGDAEYLELGKSKAGLASCQGATPYPTWDTATATDFPPQRFTGEEGESYAHSLS